VVGLDGAVVSRAVSPQMYADVLKRLIVADIGAGTVPDSVRSWSDLHDFVDANEYLIDADAETGNPDPFDCDGLVDDDALRVYMAFVDSAVGILERTLWGIS
jgi:hypothetical protein